MTINRRGWYFTQVLLAVAMIVQFVVWIPWVASEPIDAVSPEVAAQMPIDCPAVFGNHGQHSCFWPGLIRNHPWKFGLLTIGLLVAWLAFVAISVSGRGFSFRRRRVSRFDIDVPMPTTSLERMRDR
jgi:hypothetical protein